MDNLTNDFKNSIFTKDKTIIGEYLEVGIDNFIEDGILKDIPIVSTIVSVLKVGKNIYDRNLLKQTLYFLNEFNNKTIDNKKLDKYREKIEKNPKKCQEELQRVIFILNNNIDKEKSIFLAKLFRSYINEEIKWNEFCEYTEILNRLFIQDIEILKLIYNGTIDDTTNIEDLYRVERLNSLGIIGISLKSIRMFSGNNIKQDTRQDSYLVMSNYGKKFMNIINN